MKNMIVNQFELILTHKMTLEQPSLPVINPSINFQCISTIRAQAPTFRREAKAQIHSLGFVLNHYQQLWPKNCNGCLSKFRNHQPALSASKILLLTLILVLQGFYVMIYKQDYSSMNVHKSHRKKRTKKFACLLLI